MVSKNGGGFKPAKAPTDVGGYRMPDAGKIGAAKLVGYQIGEQPVVIGDEAPAVAGSKRKAGGGSGGKGRPLSQEEKEAVARREAARARVENRTMKTFGLTQ